MPIYPYKCLKCDFENDELVRSSADTPTQCPSCGSEQYERQVSAHGGYSMDSGPSSVQPKAAGSFRRR